MTAREHEYRKLIDSINEHYNKFLELCAMEQELMPGPRSSSERVMDSIRCSNKLDHEVGAYLLYTLKKWVSYTKEEVLRNIDDDFSSFTRARKDRNAEEQPQSRPLVSPNPPQKGH